MNCLRACDRVDFELVEPSAPSYYSEQPPYNPDFDYEYWECTDWSPDVDSAPQETEQYAWPAEGRARQSVYEGVHYIPVSARGSHLYE